jgi:hypothetical protein
MPQSSKGESAGALAAPFEAAAPGNPPKGSALEGLRSSRGSVSPYKSGTLGAALGFAAALREEYSQNSGEA